MSLATWKLKKIASKIPIGDILGVILVIGLIIGCCLVLWWLITLPPADETSTGTINSAINEIITNETNTTNTETNETMTIDEAFVNIFDSAFNMIWVSMIVVMMLAFFSTMLKMGRY